MCEDFSEIMAIFGNVIIFSPKYVNTEFYVIKRIEQLMQDFEQYEYRGSNSLVNDKPWCKEEFPSDPEIVAAIFTGLLDQSTRSTSD